MFVIGSFGIQNGIVFFGDLGSMYLCLRLKKLEETAEKDRYSARRPDRTRGVQTVFEICNSRK
jgi:hypothetical protein